jgi:hypothetical protein
MFGIKYSFSALIDPVIMKYQTHSGGSKQFVLTEFGGKRKNKFHILKLNCI